MTWMTTWPSGRNGPPAYREHESEAAAEAHATEIVRNGTAPHATAFELPIEEYR
jgi:hypothetical protein